MKKLLKAIKTWWDKPPNYKHNLIFAFFFIPFQVLVIFTSDWMFNIVMAYILIPLWIYIGWDCVRKLKSQKQEAEPESVDKQ